MREFISVLRAATDSLEDEVEGSGKISYWSVSSEIGGGLLKISII
jgi:hypothetical protein